MYPGYGLGISNQALDYIIPGGVSAAHKFWAAGSIVGTFNYQGLSVPGVINAGTLQQGGVAVALSNDSRITGAAQTANNLGDLANPTTTAVSNLGLANAVTSIATPGVLFTTPVSISGHAATLALVTQSANCIVAGPSSGSASTPTCRSLVALDLPNSGVHTGDLTGTFPSATVASIGGKAVSLANPLTIAGGASGGITMTVPSTSFTVARTDAAQTFTGTQSISVLSVGSSNSNLGTVTTSILDRTPTTGATSVYIGSDNNAHSSATTTQVIIQAGLSQAASTPVLSVVDTAGNALMTVNTAGTVGFQYMTYLNDSNSAYFRMFPGNAPSQFFERGITTAAGFMFIANGGQTGDILQFTNSGGTVLSKFNSGGILTAAGYKSSDGSTGVTGSTCTAWKNGLCTSL